jgi:proteic killer suppression protein
LLPATAFGLAVRNYGRPSSRRLAACNATRYSFLVIKSFRHKGLERFFTSGSKAGIRAAHAQRLARQLARLDAARRPEDMAVPGWQLHSLKGDLAGCWAVAVSGNWRLIFAFEGEDAVRVDYQDYR